MGARTAKEISARLAAEGLPGTTPVAVASNATRADEDIKTGTVAGLDALVRQLKTTGPVLIGIGQVFARLPSGYRSVAIDTVAAKVPAVAAANGQPVELSVRHAGV